MRFAILLSLLVAAACGSGQSPVAPQTWVGCYSLDRGPWDVAPESTLATFLPGSALTIAPDSFDRRSVQFYNGPPIPEDRPLRVALFGTDTAMWWVTNTDSLVVATPGLSGAAAQLFRTPRGLVGTVLDFSDILRGAGKGRFQEWRSHASLTASVKPC